MSANTLHLPQVQPAHGLSCICHVCDPNGSRAAAQRLAAARKRSER